MSEKIGWPLLPLFAWMIPPFDDTFNQYAIDLKKEAEKICQLLNLKNTSWKNELKTSLELKNTSKVIGISNVDG